MRLPWSRGKTPAAEAGAGGFESRRESTFAAVAQRQSATLPTWILRVQTPPVAFFQDVAEPGTALRSGRRDRWFKSTRPDFSHMLL